MKFPEMVIISRRRDKLFRGFRIGAKGTSVVLAPRHLGAHAMHVRLGVGVFPYVVVGVEEEVRFVIRHPLHVRHDMSHPSAILRTFQADSIDILRVLAISLRAPPGREAA